ncbi:MAG: TIGR04282 family arsenosugar biosynthesis glycosyltransferase [Candidatus Omnitrophota bacterium]
MRDKTALLIFVKFPEVGKVKTRLASAIGHRKAAEIYRRLAERTVRAAAPLAKGSAEIVICYDPPRKAGQIKRWIQKPFAYEAQRGADLGARLSHAVSNAFRRGCRKVVVIGSDCPDVRASTIRKAFRALSGKDAVIGPAADGGYYLIGLRKNNRSLFRAIPWSSRHVFQRTLEKARRERLKVLTLPVKRDIDTIEDYRRWKASEKRRGG